MYLLYKRIYLAININYQLAYTQYEVIETATKQCTIIVYVE